RTRIVLSARLRSLRRRWRWIAQARFAGPAPMRTTSTGSSSRSTSRAFREYWRGAGIADRRDRVRNAAESSMPQTEHEAEQGELHGVVPAVDQPELQAAAREEVVDAEARGDPTRSRCGSGPDGHAELRIRAEEEREDVGGDEREQEAQPEHLGWM